ncbi:uncharacterized protein LACBIDRAFT_307675 [Laccaria bicolor S238N-H82]|uniref:Predicted protein n=1 Tax=Laccaria bicolor (strain S238N-H82 / ATCC MYA-4686) TaxID=486041 RepID=B0DQQ1_LACBS|nr:uncharacterized protein LACBIDRAFT_307675 [Laccaria bicolor S238N-H82]EDR03154.1 predicted protein [Laccaria bicolor S238N-H82]|eukprot:XP_001886295.1 predicted protein [Laccaria bicolor S238N-H82]
MSLRRPFFHLRRNICSSSILKAKRSRKTTALPIPFETFRGEETDLGEGIFHFNVDWSSFMDNDLPRRLRLTSHVNVKSLILGSNLFNFAAADWDELPTELQAALQHVIRHPTLEELTILNFKNLPATLLSAARCTTLSIHKAKFRKSKFHERKNTPPNIVTRIKSFDFGLTPLSSIRALVRDRTSTDSPAVDFSSLHSLNSISLCLADEVAAFKEVMKVSPNLKYLQCEVDREVPSSLAACRSLKTLVPLFEIGNESQDPLLGLPDVLSEMSADNVLEELLIHAYVQCYTSCRTDAIWGRLDDVLSRSAFQSLHRVSLKIIVWVDDLFFRAEELEERQLGERHRKALKEELEKIGDSQFTWLKSHVKFDFSVRTITHLQRETDPEIQRYLESDLL